MSKNILIRSIQIIEEDKGYITQENALIAGVQCTADKVVDSFATHSVSLSESEKYMPIVTEIIKWADSDAAGNSDYMNKVRKLLYKSGYTQGEMRVLASLPYSYSKFLDSSSDIGEIAKVSDVNIRNHKIDEEVTFLCTRSSYDYKTFLFKNSLGQLLITFVNKDTSRKLKFKKNSKVSLQGIVKKVMTGSYLGKYDAIVLNRATFNLVET